MLGKLPWVWRCDMPGPQGHQCQRLLGHQGMHLSRAIIRGAIAEWTDGPWFAATEYGTRTIPGSIVWHEIPLTGLFDFS